jgi:hypothetical protein
MSILVQNAPLSYTKIGYLANNLIKIRRNDKQFALMESETNQGRLDFDWAGIDDFTIEGIL